jgi:hypothetical protein
MRRTVGHLEDGKQRISRDLSSGHSRAAAELTCGGVAKGGAIWPTNSSPLLPVFPRTIWHGGGMGASDPWLYVERSVAVIPVEVRLWEGAAG